MVGQREGSRADSDHVSDGASEPLSGEDLLEDWVQGLAITAEVVLKEFDLDALCALTLGPSRVGSEDGSAVGRDGSSECSSGEESLHI